MLLEAVEENVRVEETLLRAIAARRGAGCGGGVCGDGARSRLGDDDIGDTAKASSKHRACRRDMSEFRFPFVDSRSVSSGAETVAAVTPQPNSRRSREISSSRRAI